MTRRGLRTTGHPEADRAEGSIYYIVKIGTEILRFAQDDKLLQPEACSSNWLERRSPKPHVAGSNPARPVFANRIRSVKRDA